MGVCVCSPTDREVMFQRLSQVHDIVYNIHDTHTTRVVPCGAPLSNPCTYCNTHTPLVVEPT